MRAEIAKLRYLPTPRYTALVVAAAVVIVGAALLVVAPGDPARYVSIPNTALGLITALGAMVFGAWMATLEFNSGTLTAEPDRTRVLASKLALTLGATAVVGLGVAAAGGGLANLAANYAGVEIDRGGIAATLAFVLALDGLISFIPGAGDYSFGQLSQDLSAGITGLGETQNGLAMSIAGVLAWCAVIIVPGWIAFLRGDLK